jgi:hypothetical protein
MSKAQPARLTVKEMIMKNVLRAMALVAGFTLAASANAMPAASVAGLGEQAAPSVEKVTWGHKHYGYGKFYGKHYWGYRHYSHGYGHGYHWWKKYCYYNPYSYKCKHFGY